MLHLIKGVAVDETGPGILDAHHGVRTVNCFVPWTTAPNQRADISLVGERFMDGLHAPLRSRRCAEALLVEGFGDFLTTHVAASHLEDTAHHLDGDRGLRLRLKLVSHPAAIVNPHDAKAMGRAAAIKEATGGVFPHAPFNVLPEVSTVELVHRFDDAFKQLSSRAVIHGLIDGNDLDATLME